MSTSAEEKALPWRAAVWDQLGASIDMLENAIRACPDGLWGDPSRKPTWDDRGVVGFWYLAFHTLFFLEYYAADDTDAFRPPAPFTRDELDPSGLLPERPYTKEELLRYLEHCRRRVHRVVHSMSDAAAAAPAGKGKPDLTNLALLIQSTRHVQHHVAQLQLMLRQATGAAPRWVGRAASFS